MTEEQIRYAYAKCVKTIASCRTIGHLYTTINLIKIFKNSVPAAYLWMITSLSDQLENKKRQLLERHKNGFKKT